MEGKVIASALARQTWYRHFDFIRASSQAHGIWRWGGEILAGDAQTTPALKYPVRAQGATKQQSTHSKFTMIADIAADG
jgi:hypothetical protein